jgi:hypothetical protein
LPCTHTTTRCLRGGGGATPGRGRPSAGGGRAHWTRQSLVGRTSALLVLMWRAQLPVGTVIVVGQTMFMPPTTKKARQPLMSGQRDVGARAGTAPTDAAATVGVPTPLHEEQWPTRPQISVHSPSPSSGHGRGCFSAVFGSLQASLWTWPSSMVAAVPGWVLETPPSSFGEPLFVPCPSTSGFAKCLSLMLRLTPCLLFCCVQFDPQ